MTNARACELGLVLDLGECIAGRRGSFLVTIEVVGGEDGRQPFALCPACTHRLARKSDPRIRVSRIERLR